MPQDRPHPPGPRPRTLEEFATLDRARVIAHRGLSGLYPENTLVSFRKAMELGVDMMELDILLSRDDQLIVIHDETLDRTTSGRGRVRDKSLRELERLDAGSWFASEFRDERLPTLGDVLDLVGDESLLNVEIKTEAVTDRREGGIVERTIRLIHDRGFGERVVISSFDPRALHHSREIDPKIPRATLYNRDFHSGKAPAEIIAETDSASLNLSRRQVNETIVKQCHDQGKLVLVYTVNGVADMQRMISMGVDGLFTDRADLMLKLLGS